MERLTIGHLAQLGGVNLETIRYYERRGLLQRPARSAAGYRQFAPEAARRLRFIKRAQELGFSLDEIRELLALGNQPRQNRTTIRMRAQRKIEDINQRIGALSAMRSGLRQLVNQCERCGPSAECPIVASLAEESPK